jgi:hypothetical protein
MKKTPPSKMVPKPPDQKFLIMFQDSADRSIEPDWIITVKLGNKFVWETDTEHAFTFNVILPKQEYEKFESWSSLCAYDTTCDPTKKFTGFCVKFGMFDSFITMLLKIKIIKETAR